jgi:hypothetical protein
LTIDISEKMVERAKESGVPVRTLVSQTLDALAANADRCRPPQLALVCHSAGIRF